LHYQKAAEFWRKTLETDDIDLITTNYILVETTALIQRRHGIEKVQILYADIVPAMSVVWLTEPDHEDALNFTLSSNRRNLSFVDCSSIETMRRLRLQTVFTFNEHFKEQGFTVVPS
jgi:predicted nucleic acid-binding protein